MTSFDLKRSIVRAQLVLVVLSCFSLGESALVGGLTVIPLQLEWSYTNGRPLSGDGKTLVGRTTGDTFDMWTETGGKVAIPVPSSGVRWDTIDHLNFNGAVIAGAGIHQDSYSGCAWTWRPGVGLRAYSPAPNDRMYNIGVSPDGTFTIRLSETSGQLTVHRDYSLGNSPVWVTAPRESIHGASEDGTRLIGHAVYPGLSPALPCYWTSAGQLVYGYAFAGQPRCEPLYSNKDGTIIVGTMYTSEQIPDYGPVTKTFRWNTVTNHVDYYLPDGFLETEPDFVSPDGNIITFYGWLDPNHSKIVLLDTSNPTESAKGPQDISTWLLRHLYLSAADLANRTNFQIMGLSDDNTTVVGSYTKSNGATAFFLAHRLMAQQAPPETILSH